MKINLANGWTCNSLRVSDGRRGGCRLCRCETAGFSGGLPALRKRGSRPPRVRDPHQRSAGVLRGSRAVHGLCALADVVFGVYVISVRCYARATPCRQSSGLDGFLRTIGPKPNFTRQVVAKMEDLGVTLPLQELEKAEDVVQTVYSPVSEIQLNCHVFRLEHACSLLAQIHPMSLPTRSPQQAGLFTLTAADSSLPCQESGLAGSYSQPSALATIIFLACQTGKAS